MQRKGRFGDWCSRSSEEVVWCGQSDEQKRMKMKKQEEGANEQSKEDEEQTEENMKALEMYLRSILHDCVS